MGLERIQPQIIDEFIWYNSNNGINGKIEELIAPGTIWKLQELRIHFFSTFLSNEYLIVRINTSMSGFSYVLLSRLMSNSDDYIFNTFQHDYWMRSDDQVVVELSNVSGQHAIGIVVNGWAIQQKS